MADIVQYKLEKMIPELDDLEKKGVFSRDELREIVKKRRDFEYGMKRPGPLKDDFVRYIEYEKQLAALKKLRIKQLKKRLKGDDSKWRITVSDKSSNWRIFHIYEKALVRFRGDLNLWFQYAEFCRDIRASSRMRKVLGKALSFHPKVPALWIYAAAWEFEHNLNVNAARALMLKGLRFCPQSEILWLEYFRMELLFVNKIRARKLALGLDKVLSLDDGDEDDDNWKEANDNSLFISLNDEKDPCDVEKDLKSQNGSDVDPKDPCDVEKDLKSQNGSDVDPSVAVIRDLGFKMAHVIFMKAIDAVPSSARLRQRFIEMLDTVKVVKANVLEDEICRTIMKDFSTDEDCWDWLARRHLSKCLRKKRISRERALAALAKATEVYENALNHVASAKMFDFYIKLLEDLTEAEKSVSDENLHIFLKFVSDLEDMSTNLRKLYERAENSACLTDTLAEKYVKLLIRSGEVNAAQTLASKLCSGHLSKVEKLWVLRMSLEIKSVILKSVTPSIHDLQHLFKLFKHSLMETDVSDCCELWCMAMELFSCHQDYHNQILDLAASKLSTVGSVKGGSFIACVLLDWILHNQGIENARKGCNRFLALPRPALELYKHCIMIESQIASVGCEDAHQRMSRLFDSALKIYDQDTELWIDYYSKELKVGKSDLASLVYWRAKKTLKDPSRFIEACKTLEC